MMCTNQLKIVILEFLLFYKKIYQKVQVIDLLRDMTFKLFLKKIIKLLEFTFLLVFWITILERFNMTSKS